MVFLLVHNYYAIRGGGEDRVFDAEASLLEAHGHRVVRYTASNDRIDDVSRVALAARTVFNRTVYAELRELIKAHKPELVHFHNTFPLVSPGAYYAARDEGVPVVQTLHNYRLVCPQGNLVRRGRLCSRCVGRVLPWPAVLYGCYRSSRGTSAVVAAMLAIHRACGTWKSMVNAYIVPNRLARERFIQGGLPPARVHVKPHFVPRDPGPGRGGAGAVFVGRLSSEKGVATLLRAWETQRRIPLSIVGEGPLSGWVRERVAGMPHVAYLGPQSPERVLELMGDALCVVFPSECSEMFGLVVIEAFARGTPVVASSTDAIRELVDDRRTGLLFETGNAADLNEKVSLLADQPAEVRRMRLEARQEFEQKYTAERNYEWLMRIYREAGGCAGSRL